LSQVRVPNRNGWRCLSSPFEARPADHILVGAENSQKTLDRLQAVLANADNARIVISNVEATLPVIEDDGEPAKGKTKGIASSREELLSEMKKNSQLNLNFLILVFLSAVVALMPPAVTMGLMLSSGEFSLATGALLLLTVNVIR
jgi:hypothetical protein